MSIFCTDYHTPLGTNRLFLSGALCWALAFSGLVNAQSAPPCGVISGDRPHYGPIDYRKANKQQLSLVEGVHFTPGVETLTRPGSSYFGDDLSYTLRVFPNHHRALITIQRLAEREKTDSPAHAEFSVACYFDRGLRYAPDDTVLRMLYARYLIRQNQLNEAVRHLDEVIRLAGDNAFTHFNAGLIFFDMKDYDRALIQAHRAINLGFTRPDLKDRLDAVGKWTEPPAATPE